MALSATATVGEQSAQRMGQELQWDVKRGWAMKQGWSFLGRELGDAFEVEENRFLERTEDLLKGAALDRDVEIEADRLPIAVPAFGVAAQTSGRQI